MKKILTHPLISGSLLLVMGSMFVNAINLFYQVTMGNLLGPVGYGVLLSLYSILYILSIVPISTSVSIVKFISSSKDKRERSQVYEGIKHFVFKIAIVTSLGVFLFSPLIAKFLNIDDVVSVSLTAGVLFFSLVGLVNQASLQGILDFFGVVGPNLVSSVVKLVLGILLIALGFSVRGAMFAVVLGVALAYLFSIFLIGDKFTHTSKEKFKLKPFIKYSGPVLLQALAFSSFFTTDVILVKHFFPAYEAGLYAALSTLGKIVFFGASPVAQVMFPHVSKKHTKGEKYMPILIGSLGLTFAMSLLIVVIYFLFPNIIIGTLYKRYLAASGNLGWMGLFIAFYTIANLLINFLLSINKTKIVIVPIMFAVLQIVLIWVFHSSLLQIIQISLTTMVFLCLVLFAYLGYDRLKLANEGREA